MTVTAVQTNRLHSFSNVFRSLTIVLLICVLACSVLLLMLDPGEQLTVSDMTEAGSSELIILLLVMIAFVLLLLKFRGIAMLLLLLTFLVPLALMFIAYLDGQVAMSDIQGEQGIWRWGDLVWLLGIWLYILILRLIRSPAVTLVMCALPIALVGYVGFQWDSWGPVQAYAFSSNSVPQQIMGHVRDVELCQNGVWVDEEGSWSVYKIDGYCLHGGILYTLYGKAQIERVAENGDTEALLGLLPSPPFGFLEVGWAPHVAQALAALGPATLPDLEDAGEDIAKAVGRGNTGAEEKMIVIASLLGNWDGQPAGVVAKGLAKEIAQVRIALDNSPSRSEESLWATYLDNSDVSEWFADTTTVEQFSGVRTVRNDGRVLTAAVAALDASSREVWDNAFDYLALYGGDAKHQLLLAVLGDPSTSGRQYDLAHQLMVMDLRKGRVRGHALFGSSEVVGSLTELYWRLDTEARQDLVDEALEMADEDETYLARARRFLLNVAQSEEAKTALTAELESRDEDLRLFAQDILIEAGIVSNVASDLPPELRNNEQAQEAYREARKIMTDPTLSDRERREEMKVLQRNRGDEMVATVMRWVPVYDADKGKLMSFNAYMNDFVSETSGGAMSGDTPFEKDPVGAGIRMLLDPSVKTINEMLGLD